MRSLLFAVASLFAGLTLVRAEPLPTSWVAATPELAHPCLSADGGRLAVATLVDGQQTVAVLDLATMQMASVARLGQSLVNGLWWKGDNRLLVHVHNFDRDWEFVVVNLQTGRSERVPKLNNRWTEMADPLPSQDDEVLLSYWSAASVLRRVNIVTGRSVDVASIPSKFVSWLIAPGGGALAARTYSGDFKTSVLLWRPNAAAVWKQQALGPISSPHLQPVSFHPDGRLICIDYTPAGFASVILYDPASQGKTLLFQPEDSDPIGWLAFGDAPTRFRGVRLQTDRQHIHCFDDDAAGLIGKLELSLPGQCYWVPSLSRDGTRAVIETEGDTNPGTYWLLDQRSGRLQRLGTRRGAFDPANFGHSRPFAFAARDGLPLTGHLILPAGKSLAPPPLVLIAGDNLAGPRSSGRFDLVGQLLATRGYAVARVNYRGTPGLGRAFRERGDFQVDRGMPDDLEDAARWLAGQGIIDAKRVILAGFHAGGWPVAHALARPSSPFAGWINWSTPMKTRAFDASDFSTSMKSDEAAYAAFGGPLAIEHYADQISPSDLLPKIRVPAFHYYYRHTTAALLNHGGLVESFLAKNPGYPATLTVRRWADTRQQDIAANVRVYDEMLAFLAMHFPVESAPTTP